MSSLLSLLFQSFLFLVLRFLLLFFLVLFFLVCIDYLNIVFSFAFAWSSVPVFFFLISNVFVALLWILSLFFGVGRERYFCRLQILFLHSFVQKIGGRLRGFLALYISSTDRSPAVLPTIALDAMCVCMYVCMYAL